VKTADPAEVDTQQTDLKKGSFYKTTHKPDVYIFTLIFINFTNSHASVLSKLDNPNSLNIFPDKTFLP